MCSKTTTINSHVINLETLIILHQTSDIVEINDPDKNNRFNKINIKRHDCVQKINKNDFSIFNCFVFKFPCSVL